MGTPWMVKSRLTKLTTCDLFFAFIIIILILGSCVSKAVYHTSSLFTLGGVSSCPEHLATLDHSEMCLRKTKVNKQT